MKTAFQLLQEIIAAFIAGDSDSVKRLYAANADFRLGSWTCCGPDEVLGLTKSFSDGTLSSVDSVSYEDVIETKDGCSCWALSRWHYTKPNGQAGVQEYATYAEQENGRLTVTNYYGDLSEVLE